MACCGSKPFVSTPRRPAQEADIVVKNRWSVELANGSTKRFQSRDAATSYAEMYDGTMSAPPQSLNDTGGEPVAPEVVRQGAEPESSPEENGSSVGIAAPPE